MKILALDQSTRITGWAVFADGALQEYGKFDAENAGADIGKRLTYIKEKVKALIDKYDIQKILIEEIQLQNTVGNNVVTYKKLAYVQAVLIQMLDELKLPYEVIASSSWKSTLGIKGRARAEQKKNAQEFIIKTYNIKVIQDTADAICIGLAFLQNDKSGNEEKGAW